ncbi:MAG: hypothetical protein A2934_01890, partial [Candidatus Sungbacteria bacterium RIFCSPLOWO2_01_FULL_47_10]
MLSIVIPVFNEEKNVAELHRELVSALKKNGKGGSHEIIFVNDGSTDGTLAELKKLAGVKIISFTTNFGQTPAFDAGFKAAKGDIVVSMDGDLQNDPADIPSLLKKLDEGYDVVCGWRHPRNDSGSKVFVSYGARFLRRILLGDTLHDAGCSLRVYRKHCLEGLDLYSEMHRFIPSILASRGWRVAEIPTHHRARKFGVTKYNWARSIKGFTDMVTLWFWYRFRARPVHLFGGGGLLLFGAGFILAIGVFVARIFFGVSLSDKIWPLVSIFLMLSGIQLFVTGLLADIAI